ncbi:hypothetical protein CWB99_07585 [Pseudoalteromonas rubra]|uniref:Uncharacterized protein n=1 Tax=Pseudoalteromonas rubra TaxID=43658 RepID=A0A5S3WP38_9GAMM|nr:hypothetical protein [Pseudoalteromonas rubra]TMP29941.1 hypothetical protein CWB99_07585 [Pseudoalteromonas rubra]TMP32169.1 hypothetical protein CWC00_13310 [Pseudoalteromonas rubra]
MLIKYSTELASCMLIGLYLILIGSSSVLMSLWIISVPLFLLVISLINHYQGFRISFRQQMVNGIVHFLMLLTTLGFYLDIGQIATGSSTSALLLVVLPLYCVAAATLAVGIHWLYSRFVSSQ